jgi:hypothetical protein
MQRATLVQRVWFPRECRQTYPAAAIASTQSASRTGVTGFWNSV